MSGKSSSGESLRSSKGSSRSLESSSKHSSGSSKYSSTGSTGSKRSSTGSKHSSTKTIESLEKELKKCKQDYAELKASKIRKVQELENFENRKKTTSQEALLGLDFDFLKKVVLEWARSISEERPARRTESVLERHIVFSLSRPAFNVSKKVKSIDIQDGEMRITAKSKEDVVKSIPSKWQKALVSFIVARHGWDHINDKNLSLKFLKVIAPEISSRNSLKKWTFSKLLESKYFPKIFLDIDVLDEWVGVFDKKEFEKSFKQYFLAFDPKGDGNSINLFAKFWQSWLENAKFVDLLKYLKASLGYLDGDQGLEPIEKFAKRFQKDREVFDYKTVLERRYAQREAKNAKQASPKQAVPSSPKRKSEEMDNQNPPKKQKLEPTEIDKLDAIQRNWALYIKNAKTKEPTDYVKGKMKENETKYGSLEKLREKIKEMRKELGETNKTRPTPKVGNEKPKKKSPVSNADAFRVIFYDK